MSEAKLKLNKELSVFNDFVVINVFEKENKEKGYTKQLLTIKHAYKPKDAEQWKQTDFISAKKIDTLIKSLEELKVKLGGQ